MNATKRGAEANRVVKTLTLSNPDSIRAQFFFSLGFTVRLDTQPLRYVLLDFVNAEEKKNTHKNKKSTRSGF